MELSPRGGENENHNSQHETCSRRAWTIGRARAVQMQDKVGPDEAQLGDISEDEKPMHLAYPAPTFQQQRKKIPIEDISIEDIPTEGDEWDPFQIVDVQCVRGDVEGPGKKGLCCGRISFRRSCWSIDASGIETRKSFLAKFKSPCGHLIISALD